MIDCRETCLPKEGPRMRDIVDDEDGYEDDIEELKELFGPRGHRYEVAV